jgi:hypothetical protein
VRDLMPAGSTRRASFWEDVLSSATSASCCLLFGVVLRCYWTYPAIAFAESDFLLTNYRLIKLSGRAFLRLKSVVGSHFTQRLYFLL